MDNLTHGLLGLAVGALGASVHSRLAAARTVSAARSQDGPQARGPSTACGTPTGWRLDPTEKAMLLGALLASEIPDLDTLWPTEPVLQALQAHRGISHSLIAAPVVALLATLVAAMVYRKARLWPVWAVALLTVPVAHLLPDLWTGWGTRLLLPFSDVRLALDWTMVVDPLVTLPLAAGAFLAFRRKRLLPLQLALAVAALYVGGRGVIQSHLTSRVASAHPGAETVAVFPSWLGPLHWRWVVVDPSGYTAGSIRLLGPLEEQNRIERVELELPEPWTGQAAIGEALAWARFPSTEIRSLPDGGSELRISDLRYHLHGKPTLAFVFELGEEGDIRSARLDRGGSPGDLWERWRTGARSDRSPTKEPQTHSPSLPQ